MSETWKRTDTTPPFLSWALIVRNSEKTLEATLRSLRERTPQAEIVVVDTMSSDGSPEIAKRYADVWVEWAGPRGTWNRDMSAFDDAAAARQFAFEQASGRWRGWIDSDDRLPGPEEVEKLLKLNNRWKPEIKKGKVINGHDGPVQLEDLLAELEKVAPEADCIWAPYLYRRDAHGHAMTWQTRERIVRWADPPRWRWAEAAHEILVPISGSFPPRVEFAHLLFVHEKDFSDEAYRYSIQRHFDILIQQYDRGEKTTRRCLYLAEFAKTLCPEREREFIQAGYDAATTKTDRYRALISRGMWFGARSFYWDALEAFSAATHLRSDLPDAWVAGGEWWALAQDPIKASDWLEKGLALPINSIESYVNARDLAVKYPTLLAVQYQDTAKLYVRAGDYEKAADSLQKAMNWSYKVRESDAVGADKEEARARLIRIANDWRAQKQAMAVHELAKYLLENDEPLKLRALLAALPWNIQDHPVAIGIERELAPVLDHLETENYWHYYDSDDETGCAPSPEDWMTVEGAVPRVWWIAHWLNDNCPNATIVDVGASDGIVGIPVLRHCPGVRYIAIEPNVGAASRLKERIEKYGFADRASVHASRDIGVVAPKSADVVIWTEVIEHVPDPGAELTRLRGLLKDGGYLILTTPWGAFDCGAPGAETVYGTPRGHKGHVRAYSARDLMEVAKNWDVRELLRDWAPIDQIGDSMNAVLRNTPARNGFRVSFAVPGALWDWNGRTVRAEGIGASEETIVYLAEALADGNRVEVFGPTPDPDVHNGVPYWPREQIRLVGDGKIVVSRGPTFGPKLNQEGLPSPRPLILWLQDAVYEDLTAEVAAEYERIVVVSEWHKKWMNHLHGVPLEKMEVLYNFLLAEHFVGVARPERKRDHFVYTSSPDRGLVRLLKLWPRIREKLPEATLDVFYGWRGCARLGFSEDPAWNVRYRNARMEYEKLRYQPGIREFGMVNHAQIAREYMHAGVWAYPSGDHVNGPFSETCVHPDTLVSVPGDHSNGGPVRVRIADLAGQTNVPVYAYDEKEHRFRIATMRWCKQTKIANEMIALTLDDGSALKLTPDHRILTFDGEWVEAGDIREGDRLCALHHRYAVMIKDVDGRWMEESRLVGEWMAGRRLKRGEHVDHLDPTRRDNRPESLQIMSASDHFRKTHRGKTLKKTQKDRLATWSRDPANGAFIRENVGRAASIGWARMTEAERADRIAKMHRGLAEASAKDPARRRELARKASLASARMMTLAGETMCMADWARRVGITPQALSYRIKMGWPLEEALTEGPQNHRVVSVQRIAGGPVYDMEVEELHNFVADGVVVHNCCAAAIKARAGGCVPVCPPIAALEETAACPESFFVDFNDDDGFVSACVQATQVEDAARERMAKEAIEKFERGVFLPRWKELLR